MTPSQVPSQAAPLLVVLANVALTLSTAEGSSDRKNSGRQRVLEEGFVRHGEITAPSACFSPVPEMVLPPAFHGT